MSDEYLLNHTTLPPGKCISASELSDALAQCDELIKSFRKQREQADFHAVVFTREAWNKMVEAIDMPSPLNEKAAMLQWRGMKSEMAKDNCEAMTMGLEMACGENIKVAAIMVKKGVIEAVVINGPALNEINAGYHYAHIPLSAQYLNSGDW